MKRKITTAMILITVGLVIAAIVGHRDSAWQDAPRPLQSGAQPGGGPPLQQGREALSEPQDGIQGCFVPGVELAVECLEHAPRCPYEDGDPSGWPCLWVDPSTGKIIYSDSREYWS